jgi:hypothetical protein
LYFGTNAESNGFMILAECGLGFHAHENELTDWSFSLEPGLAMAFDTLKVAICISGEAGYQWVFKKGLFIGIAVGGKSIWMDGNLIIPDLKLRIGYGL